jgi:hypothetical protein
MPDDPEPTARASSVPLGDCRVRQIAQLLAHLIAQARNFLYLSRNFLRASIRFFRETNPCRPLMARRR